MTDKEKIAEVARWMGWQEVEEFTGVTKPSFRMIKSISTERFACQVIIPGKTPMDVVTIFYWWPDRNISDAWMLLDRRRELFGKAEKTMPLHEDDDKTLERLQELNLDSDELIYDMPASEAARAIFDTILEVTK